MNFGHQLVVLQTTSIFGKFLLHALEVVWSFEQRTILYEFIRVKQILACQELLN